MMAEPVDGLERLLAGANQHFESMYALASDRSLPDWKLQFAKQEAVRAQAVADGIEQALGYVKGYMGHV